MNIPCFAQSVSLSLSSVLEALGVNEATVYKRRKLYHQVEVIKEIGGNLLGKYCGMTIYKIYQFGSRVEGSTTLGMHSDIDLVYIIPQLYTIVHSNSEKCQGFLILMIDKTAPNGYCKLKFTKPGYFEPFYCDYEDNRFIPNTHFEKHFRITTDMGGLNPMFKDGPAANCKNTDHVKGVLLPASLFMKSETINRFRTYHWPTDPVIDKVIEESGLVVPVGHPKSENAILEWRMSYSFAERLLIFDFNITQLRTLTILKMIKKTLFQPLVGDNFTSYHCKTTVFHTIAKTVPSLWRKDRLFDCVLISLCTHQQFLSSRYCPHFFDLSVNLFAGKLSPIFCKSLSIFLKDLMSKNLRCLFQIQIDDFGSRILNFHSKLGPDCFESRDSIENQMIGEIAFERHQYLIEYSRFPYVLNSKSKFSLKKQIRIGFMLIKELLHIIGNGNESEDVVAKFMLPHYLVEHLSLIAAYRIKKRQPISEMIVTLFILGFHTDATSSKLKLASILYCTMEYSKSLKILNEVQDVYASSNVHLPTCFKYGNTYNTLSEITPDRACNNVAYSCCVGFKRKDIWCCPKGLRRSVVNYFSYNIPDHQDSHAFHDDYGIEIDSKVMFHYLKFLTCSGLSRNGPKHDALKDLMYTVFGNPKSWSTCFFKISNKRDIDRVKMMKAYNPGLVISKLINNLRRDPWGSIRQCLTITFDLHSSVQHTELALILIGYSFELQGNTKFACAFYFMSFIVEPNLAAVCHLSRVHPSDAILEYLQDRSRSTLIEQELNLIPEIVEAFASVMKANIFMGLLQKGEFNENIYRTRCHVRFLNALLSKSDILSTPALEVFPRNCRIIQANRTSLLL